MLKEYFKKKSKLSIVIDVAIGIMLLLLLIPGTRKDMAALILRPAIYIHQPKVKANKVKLKENTYNWKLQNVDGIVFTLHDFKDKVVFINLWATHCPPCIAEMPDLQKLYNDYGSKVEFLFVSNEEAEKVNRFMTKKKLSLPTYKPLSQYPDDFETSSIPTTFVVNKEGEIVIHKVGLAKWNSQRIRKVLDALINK